MTREFKFGHPPTKIVVGGRVYFLSPVMTGIILQANYDALNIAPHPTEFVAL